MICWLGPAPFCGGKTDAGHVDARDTLAFVAADDDPTTEELRAVQAEREQDERQRAAVAPSDAEERAAQRRAEKAGYLKRKLDEQAASEQE